MKKIKFKLWGGMMILVLIVLIILWLFQIVFLENFYKNIKIAEIKKEAKNIMLVNDKTQFTNRLDNFAFNNNLNVEVLDSKGNSIHISGDIGSSGHVPLLNTTYHTQVLKDIMANKEPSLSISHPRFGNKFILLGLPIKNNGKITGAMIITMALAPVEDTASILKKQLFFIFLILIPTALIISFIIAGTFTKPILEIKRVSEALALGNFTIKINSNKTDEIGELAKTINNLGDKLSKIEQLRRDLIANVSHELRTPLSIIRGYAETIKDVTGSIPEKREHQLDIIIDESERLSGIVDDILNLSQLQSGYFVLNKKAFKLKDLLHTIESRYDILSKKTNITFFQEYHGEVLVYADKARLKQVFYNLINNAFNHTLEGGYIKINAFEKNTLIRVEISDTGVGIPTEEIPYIWDRYYKSEKSSEKRALGTGLGLAIVKGILESHKVNFGVESIKEIGTTFWFELPKYKTN
ncbi:HAMP domain-containing histidine kinase [Clostridium felsineum]|uniref:sensor histidine kinase n=1 Tax=Clostridium felsineum TaxID=36839 RepID=UPI00214D32C1|nr:HAMP domain-containing sensor histidine kinase [Clostridium felsineum]MCR3759021.1 HAMP domain-containing histidine kinase [Clostridium felsineum]